MNEFEFLFALFGLMLGLSIVEVVGGFARAIEFRLRPDATFRIGLLTPMLGLFVLLDLLSFWAAAWRVRDVVGVSGLSLLAVTFFTSAYYMAAHLVFPREVEGAATLDGHFFRVRRFVIGGMFALLLCQLGWYMSVPAIRPLLAKPVPLAMTIVLVALMVAAMAVRGRRAVHVVMAALVLRYLAIYLI